ncbi:hypothetical protein [Candidatus Nitrosotenuis uzonensis]|uniref:PEFG-CTERM sorting domain-containing protein n=1 Tax=Candidatus Nitrosotenuis uzonensis TaxID=1407055 RepID=V6ASR0_9ARCH|nr:hypothetical protein [Candidatus Nitrosotenuis uzonensis]CDI05647.1 exported hypothetical protein [Candidatus Nitrosotenuis uzonensis]
MRLRALLLAIIAFPVILPSFADTESYNLIVDENTFSIEFSLDGKMIAMDIDKESKSLLIGIIGVQSSEFLITFPSEMLSAENDDFIVLVDGLEIEYTATNANGKTTITFPVIADSEEIEIIGTQVVPEFPFGVLMLFGLIITVMIAFTQKQLRMN